MIRHACFSVLQGMRRGQKTRAGRLGVPWENLTMHARQEGQEAVLKEIAKNLSHKSHESQSYNPFLCL